MRAYITVLEGDKALVPYFVKHYSRLGATEFPVLIYADAGTEGQEMDATCSLIRSAGGEPLPLATFPQQEFSAFKRDQYIRAHHNGKWAFFCDVDEFAQCSPKQVQRWVKNRVHYVAGRWLDRLAPGGKLVDVDTSRPLEEQYPMGCHFRQRIRAGDAVFVLSQEAPNIHHPYVCNWGRRYYPNAVPIILTHHFKWQGNVIRRLRNRCTRIKAKGKEGSGWWKNVRKMLRHLEHYDGINPKWLRPVPPTLGV